MEYLCKKITTFIKFIFKCIRECFATNNQQQNHITEQVIPLLIQETQVQETQVEQLIQKTQVEQKLIKSDFERYDDLNKIIKEKYKNDKDYIPFKKAIKPYKNDIENTDNNLYYDKYKIYNYLISLSKGFIDLKSKGFNIFEFIKNSNNEFNNGILVHGTNSENLPLMLYQDRICGSGYKGKPAITPSGMLIEKNIIPLNGELSFEIFMPNGINKKNTSFVKIEHYREAVIYARTDFSTGCTELNIERFDELNRFIDKKMFVLRWLRSGKNVGILRKSIIAKKNETIEKYIHHEKFFSLIGHEYNNQIISNKPTNEISTLKIGQIVAVKRSDLTYMFCVISNITDTTVSVYLDSKGEAVKYIENKNLILFDNNELENELSKVDKIEVCDWYNNLFYLERMLELCDNVRPYRFSVYDNELMDKKFPIVFLSNNISNSIHVGSDISEERGVPGSVILGEQIQLAFTKKRNVAELASLVNRLGVNVFKMSTLECLSLMFENYRKSLPCLI